MNIIKRRGAVVASMVALALVAAACGSDSNNDSSATTASGGTDTTAAGAATTAAGGSDTTVKVSGTIQGSGSTLQKPYQEEAHRRVHEGEQRDDDHLWRRRFGQGSHRPRIQGRQLRRVGLPVQGHGQAGGADPLLPDPVLAHHGVVQPQGRRQAAARPPTRSPRSSRARSRPGTIPAIAADNPGVTLPSTDITVAHRSDGSGTTQNFTEYLVKAAPTTWTLKSGSTVEWPADTQAGNGNAGRGPDRQVDRRRGWLHRPVRRDRRPA